VLAVIVLLGLLVVWVVGFGESGGGRNGRSDGVSGKAPVESITPGPSVPGPAISERPGGRDESGDKDTGGGTGGEGDGNGTGSPGTGEGGAGSNAAVRVPAGTKMPDCRSGSVALTLRSRKNSYGPDERPMFDVVARNSSGSDCKMDFGDRSAVLTITHAGDDDPLWASDDCPKSGQLLYRVPAHGQAVRTVEWDRRAGAPECATPPAGAAKAGTYLVEVTVDGVGTARVSVSLSKD
jgi:hypothetical protein